MTKKMMLALVMMFGLMFSTMGLPFISAATKHTMQSGYKGFPSGYCTYYAAQRFDQTGSRPGVNWRGNAGEWVNNAAVKGQRTSANANDARSGSIIVWQGGGYGHVGFVDRVYDNYIEISEMNWGRIVGPNAVTTNFNKVTSTRLSKNNLKRGSYTFAGYIFP